MIDIPPLRIPPCLVPYCCFQWYAVATLLPILLYCTSLLQRRQAIANFQTALRKNKKSCGNTQATRSPRSKLTGNSRGDARRRYFFVEKCFTAGWQKNLDCFRFCGAKASSACAEAVFALRKLAGALAPAS